MSFRATPFENLRATWCSRALLAVLGDWHLCCACAALGVLTCAAYLLALRDTTWELETTSLIRGFRLQVLALAKRLTKNLLVRASNLGAERLALGKAARVLWTAVLIFQCRLHVLAPTLACALIHGAGRLCRLDNLLDLAVPTCRPLVLATELLGRSFVWVMFGVTCARANTLGLDARPFPLAFALWGRWWQHHL
jgi:hypothetical protein